MRCRNLQTLEMTLEVVRTPLDVAPHPFDVLRQAQEMLKGLCKLIDISHLSFQRDLERLKALK